jgi:hypothetical protein
MLSLFRSSARRLPQAQFHTSSLLFKEKKPAKKEKKDAIKKPTQAFFFYVKERFAQNKEELMKYEFSQRTGVLRKEWDNLSLAEKAPFESAANADKERYAVEVAQAKKDAPPKRPLTSYLQWFNENRDGLAGANPGVSFAELGKIAGAQWKELSENDKSRFKTKYEKEITEWKNTYAKWKESRA